jgi:hypothetical protein
MVKEGGINTVAGLRKVTLKDKYKSVKKVVTTTPYP